MQKQQQLQRQQQRRRDVVVDERTIERAVRTGDEKEVVVVAGVGY